jgi:hypothetical protein
MTRLILDKLQAVSLDGIRPGWSQSFLWTQADCASLALSNDNFSTSSSCRRAEKVLYSLEANVCLPGQARARKNKARYTSFSSM